MIATKRRVLMYHLKKHLIHAVFLLAMVLALQASNIAMSGLAVVGVVLATLASLELGLWIIHRRDALKAVSS